MDLSKLNWEQAQDPTKKELLKEARAWGFDTIDEFYEAMDEEYRKYEHYGFLGQENDID